MIKTLWTFSYGETERTESLPETLQLFFLKNCCVEIVILIKNVQIFTDQYCIQMKGDK